jgi:hypothetical protein
MAEYDNTNRGVLFKNDRKEAGDKKPEYTGSLNVDGVEFFLDAWLKDGKSGKFMSVSVKRKDKQPQGAAPAQRAPSPSKQAAGADDFDSGIPF